MIKVLGVLWLGLSSVAAATDVVSIPRVTPYAEGAANDAVRNECHWNAKLSENIAHAAKGGVLVVDKDVSQAGGKVLSMKIIEVHAIGGGSMTGQKWAKVRGELREGDTVLGSFVAERRSIFGAWTACGVLDRIGGELGEDIAEWLANPTMDAKL